jgi:arginine N-succinyltransferase
MIGKTHEETKPALQMLIDEGFKISDELDIIDGGPKIEVNSNEIRTITSSRLATIATITKESLETPIFILSNNSLDFKACLSSIKIHETQGTLTIPFAAAQALQIEPGDTIRYVSSHREKKA